MFLSDKSLLCNKIHMQEQKKIVTWSRNLSLYLSFLSKWNGICVMSTNVVEFSPIVPWCGLTTYRCGLVVFSRKWTTDVDPFDSDSRRDVDLRKSPEKTSSLLGLDSIETVSTIFKVLRKTNLFKGRSLYLVGTHMFTLLTLSTKIMGCYLISEQKFQNLNIKIFGIHLIRKIKRDDNL